MTWETYSLYLATVAVFFATPPGPSQLLMLSNAARHGARRSMATAAGDLTANAFQMLAAGLGLATLIATSDHLLDVIKWAGVAYLIYVGIRTFRAAPATPEVSAPQVSLRALYFQGFFTSASNPKAVFFFAALFPQFIDPARPLAAQLLILGATYIVVDGTILTLYAHLAERVMGRLRHRGRLLNRVSGAMMLAAAALLGLKDVHAR
ncbi:LysE family translocator [Oceaniglobus trochenteri]|uniref:LysE family translocator n=1 Tax=Oceaniglobus trochenteri TaxID=2763260 RepID=UPI001CFFA72A|nr:LysE family translocator [Oceaniglobus trochenteri]